MRSIKKKQKTKRRHTNTHLRCFGARKKATGSPELRTWTASAAPDRYPAYRDSRARTPPPACIASSWSALVRAWRRQQPKPNHTAVAKCLRPGPFSTSAIALRHRATLCCWPRQILVWQWQKTFKTGNLQYLSQSRVQYRNAEEPKRYRKTIFLKFNVKPKNREPEINTSDDASRICASL